MALDSATAALLLVLCRASLTGEEERRAKSLAGEAIDWAALVQVAALHEVSTLVWRNLVQMKMEPPVLAACQALESAARQTMLDGTLRLAQSVRVVRWLQDLGLAPIVLKGFAVGQLLYRDLVLRPTSDLDLLLPQQDLEKAVAMLESLGFPPPGLNTVAFHLAHGYHLPVEGQVLGQPLVVELHWDLAPRRVFRLDLASLSARAEPFALDSVATRRLSMEDTLLHLVLHIRKHRYVGLRWLCDVAELLRVTTDQLDWPYVVQTARTAGLSTLLYTTLSLARTWLDAPTDLTVLRQVEPPRLRRLLTDAIIPADLLDVPDETDREGWTRLAPVEILMLDRPESMWRELRYRFAPPLEGALGAEATRMSRRERLAFGARRLVDRSETLLHPKKR